MTSRPSCSIEGCDRARGAARGMCDMHYTRWKRHGDPLIVAQYHQPKPPCSIEGCPAASLIRGWCDKHYRRWRAQGDPLGLGHAEPYSARRLIEQWVASRDQGEDCWLDWPFPVPRNGYPACKDGRKYTKIGWLALTLNGQTRPAPPLHVMLHSCDTPLCLNPGHLSWGSFADNNKQARERGRVPGREGIKHPLCRLSEAEVLAIRASSESNGVLATHFGVSRSHVASIRSRKTWAHL